ncbi:MAG: PKD domain-containing protein [Bacteroidetes bacterium]|nr:PKD domain-containing protein [Bacteroidota bacterium]
MKKSILFVVIMAFILVMGAQAQQATVKSSKQPVNEQVDTRVDNMRYWMKKAAEGLTPYNPQVPIEPAIYRGTKITVNGVKTTNSPDIPVTNLTNVTESENSVFVDPNNAQYLLNSNNSTSWSGGSVGDLYGANFFQSANGGTTWGGSPLGAGGANSGDPTTAISLSGRQYVNYISDPGGQGVSYSDNGVNWTAATIAPNPGSLADKNHMWIDNKSTSPNEGNLYCAWTDFGGTDDTEIKISRSTNDGVTWSSPLNISAAINAGSHNQGVNVQTGPNGEVYVAWAVYDGWPTDESAIGFAKSTNGGASYQTATRIISNIKGIRTTAVSKNHRVNSFPVMAVDISNGPNSGNIYIVWTNVGVPGVNTGTNKSVYMIRSTNGGTSWSTPVRVNQGPNTAGKEAYFPWISCDPETGVLSVVFYDDRNVSSTQCEVYSAYSTDAGNTWSDFKVSDVAFTPAAIPGLAGGYMGDYLGITSKGGKVYPCWTDNRGGIYMTYVSPYELGLNASFSANVTTVCSGGGVIFTNSSTGNPISWNWSFPGGTPSSYNGQNPPTITYSTPGTYDVSLTVSDGTNNDTETKTGYITVKNVIADFTGTPTTLVVGNSVTFTDNSSCNPTTWTWSFPGGTPSSYVGQTPPAITYNTVGTYDVTLTVTKPGSTDTRTRTGYITVSPPEFNMTNGNVTTCTGNFYDSGGPTGSYQNGENFTMTFNPSTPGSMVRFNFTSFSTESGYDYLRIYNGTSTAAPLIGTYHGTTGPGIVTASNTSGALTFNFTSDVSVISTGWVASIDCYSSTNPPVADFSASNLTPGVGITVTFTDLSTNVPTSWNWVFTPNTVTYVNGTNANSQNPQVQFNAIGLYTVSLTATNAYGSDNETKTNYISAGAPEYIISNGTVTTCTGNFYDSGGSSGNYLNNESYTETFYPATSGNSIRFTFNTFNTESGYDFLRIYNGINTSAPLIGSYSGTTSPGVVTASNGSGALTFYWTSDGSVVSSGWSASIACIAPSLPPVADFSASSVSPGIGQSVILTDLSTNTPTSWSWTITPNTYTFVNGTNANSQNPEVQFSALGSYTVSLTATNAFGSDTETKTNYITVGNPEYIIANGTVTTCSGNFYDTGGSSGSYQNNETITETFYPSTSGNMIRFTFNSFSTESGYDYLRIYNGTSTSAPLIGSYSGTTSPGVVTASNTSGALTFYWTSDYSVTYTGWSAAISCYNPSIPPVADFSASNVNPGINTDVTFTDLTTGGPTSWTWGFTPNTVVYTNGTNANSQNPVVQFTGTGLYTVSLTATNAFGTDTETKTDYIDAELCSYCSSTSNNATEEWIGNVTFNTINNTTTGTAGYENFTTISTDVSQGVLYNLSVTCDQTATFTENCWAFIDWNQDCDFTDANESFDLGQVIGPGTMSLDITIPTEALTGTTRMRISLKYYSDPTPCETFAYGQVEDYSLNIQVGNYLTVLPAVRYVGEVAGNTTFDVTSNTNWTASSNQTWCTVTPGGSGNATITADYLANNQVAQRDAEITVSASGVSPVVVSVVQDGIALITLNLKIYLEGLYIGEGLMHKAQNESGDQFPGSTADQISVALHDATAPYGIIGSPYTGNLDVNGTCQITIPSIHSGNYFIVIKHRNSIETWTAGPVNLISTPILYDMSTSAASAYGNNLIFVSSNVFAIYCGDENQDGAVDSGDMGDIDNDAGSFMMGYLVTDINGDGSIDSNDLGLTDNNSSNFVGTIQP